MKEELEDRIEEIYHQQDEKDKKAIQELKKNSFNRFVDKVIRSLKGGFSKFLLSKFDPRIIRIKEEGYQYFLYSRNILYAAKYTIEKIFHLDD